MIVKNTQRWLVTFQSSVKKIMSSNLFCLIISIFLEFAIFSYSYAAPAASEYQIKSVFVYNFVNFVTWPETSFSSNDSNFNICILGEDPFGMLLDVTTEGQNAHNRPIAVQRIKKISDIRPCQILFVSESEEYRLADIFAFTERYTILTVSDIEDFILRGGMVEFFNSNNKVRLGINPDLARNANLHIDANLIQLSTIIKP